MDFLMTRISSISTLIPRKREHSRKPDELYPVIEKCGPGPYLELFARHKRRGWKQWGNEIEDYIMQMTLSLVK
jgi:N6-adenosine-specific RNA methylase IME4